MDNLISGLIGALLATIISIIYIHISEIIRRRYELAVDAVTYSDEIYGDIQVVDAYKTMIYGGEEVEEKSLEPLLAATDRLRSSITSSNIHIRAALIYGTDSDELNAFEGLRSNYQTCTSLLWNSNPENWADTSKEIHALFEKQIDPLRNLLENRLIKSTKLITIIKVILKKPNKSVKQTD